MNYYLIKIGSDQNVTQQEVMDLFKSSGEDMIQTSGGLCLKTEKAVAQVRELNQKFQALTILKVEPHEESAELSDDVRAFIKRDSSVMPHSEIV